MASKFLVVAVASLAGWFGILGKAKKRSDEAVTKVGKWVVGALIASTAIGLFSTALESKLKVQELEEAAIAKAHTEAVAEALLSSAKETANTARRASSTAAMASQNATVASKNAAVDSL